MNTGSFAGVNSGPSWPVLNELYLYLAAFPLFSFCDFKHKGIAEPDTFRKDKDIKVHKSLESKLREN
jgi:hypothetical protein